MTPLEKFTSKLGPLRNGMAKCPHHEDSTPSLSVTEGADGRVLLHCHGGCRTEDVVAKLGLTLADLYPEGSKNGPTSDRRVVARYEYTDETGAPLFRVLRYSPKGFSQQRYENGQWLNKLAGRPVTLYRLPQVIDAVTNGLPIYICEGEKDADVVNRLAEGRAVGTCGPMGAGKWDKVAPVAERVLKGATVRVVSDADQAGYAHALDVFRSVSNIEGTTVTIHAPAEGKDLADHVDTHGHKVAELVTLSVPDLERLAAGEADDDDTENDDGSDGPDPDWLPVDLGPALRGEREMTVPTVARRDDGQNLIYPGSNWIHGDSGDGKSLVAAMIAVQELAAGHHVVWVDAEDPNEMTIVERLGQLGADPAQVAERFHYINPKTPTKPANIEAIRSLVLARRVRYVVLDSIGELFGLDGINENADDEVGPWIRRVIRRIIDVPEGHTMPAVLTVDHATKAKDNPDFPSGSKRKRAAVTGHALRVKVAQPYTRETGGRVDLICAKDRHGNFRKGDVVASVELNIYPDGGYTFHLWPPATTAADPADLGLRLAARAAVEAVKASTEPMSSNLLQASMKIKTSTDTKRAGIELAVNAGCIRVEPGPRSSILHFYVADFEVSP